MHPDCSCGCVSIEPSRGRGCRGRGVSVLVEGRGDVATTVEHEHSQGTCLRVICSRDLVAYGLLEQSLLDGQRHSVVHAVASVPLIS